LSGACHRPPVRARSARSLGALSHLSRHVTMSEPIVEPAESSGPSSGGSVEAEAAIGGNATLALSLLLPLLLLAVFFLSRRGGSRGTKIILLGPSNSGKTSIQLRLRFGRVSPTVTSMQSTTATVALKADNGRAGRSVQLTDAPGSGRLRGHLMSELPGTAAFVCVLDGTSMAAHAKEAAQLLYDVLTHEAIERAPPPLLIAVNKSDMPGASAPAAARKLLEAEVSRVRLARTTMQDTSERTRQRRGIAAGSADEPFSFDQLGSAVEFIACSATKPELTKLTDFMLQHT